MKYCKLTCGTNICLSMRLTPYIFAKEFPEITLSARFFFHPKNIWVKVLTVVSFFISMELMHLLHNNLPSASYFQLGLKSLWHSAHSWLFTSGSPWSSFLSRLTHISSPKSTKNSLLVADGKKLTSGVGAGGVWVISLSVLLSCCLRCSRLTRFFSNEAEVDMIFSVLLPLDGDVGRGISFLTGLILVRIDSFESLSIFGFGIVIGRPILTIPVEIWLVWVGLAITITGFPGFAAGSASVIDALMLKVKVNNWKYHVTRFGSVRTARVFTYNIPYF